MSKCTCVGTDRERMEYWEVLEYRGNKTNILRFTVGPSEYSTVRCRRCGMVWKTKAGYVEELLRRKQYVLPDFKKEEP